MPTNITLSEKEEQRLKEHLISIVPKMLQGRTARNRKIEEGLLRWEAKAEKKTYPWPGASGMHIPVVAAHGDSIKSRLLTGLKASDRPVNCVSFMPEVVIPGLEYKGKEVRWRDISEDLENYFNFEVSPAGEVDLEMLEDEMVDDLLHTGTICLDTRFETITELDFVADGSKELAPRVVRDNVQFYVRPIENVHFPPYYHSLDRIPLVTIEYPLRPGEIRERVERLGWDEEEVDEFLEKNGETKVSASSIQQVQARIEGNDDPSHFITGDLEIAETWLRFDLFKKGQEVRIVVDHSLRDPGCIFRVYPWPHDWLPIDLARYIRRRKRMLGMSLPERLESLDEGISTNANQAIDAATVGNTPWWKTTKGSEAAKNWTSVRPGLNLNVDDMTEIEPMTGHPVKADLFEIGNILNAWAEKVSKINDYNLGRDSAALGRQGTATSTIALLRESGQYFDGVGREIRVCLNKAFQKWLDLIAIHKPLERMRQVLGDRADLVLAAIQLPPGDLRKRIGVRIAFSDTAATRELAKQEEAAKFQLLQPYYQGILALAQIRLQFINAAIQGDPSAAFMVDLCDQIAVNAEFHAKSLLETYGETFTSAAIPSWEDALVASGSPNRKQLIELKIRARQAANSAGGNGQPVLAPPAGSGGGQPGIGQQGSPAGAGGPFPGFIAPVSGREG